MIDGGEVSRAAFFFVASLVPFVAMATLVLHSALVPAAAAAAAGTQSLYNSRSGHALASRVWMKKRNQSLSTTKIVQEKAVLRCCATLPGDESEQGPYLKDLQVPEAWAEPSVALQVNSYSLYIVDWKNLALAWSVVITASLQLGFRQWCRIRSLKIELQLLRSLCACS